MDFVIIKRKRSTLIYPFHSAKAINAHLEKDKRLLLAGYGYIEVTDVPKTGNDVLPISINISFQGFLGLAKVEQLRNALDLAIKIAKGEIAPETNID